MSMFRLLTAELWHRKLNITLSLLALVAAATLFVASPTLLGGYRRESEQQLGAMQAATESALTRMQAETDTELQKMQGKVEEALTYMSCRSAIKFGQSLSLDEMQSLINQMAKLTRPYTCPHGRPTMVSLDMKELGKMFGRI